MRRTGFRNFGLFSHFAMTNKQIIKQMPGWTINSAYYAFGGRLLCENQLNRRKIAA